MTATPLLELRGVSKRFGDHQALRSLDLCVGAGEVYGLLGPNGAGKTTTIHILTGFHLPDGGDARIDGVDVAADPAGARARIGYVPESVALYPYLSGLENLEHFTRLAGKRPPRGELRAHLERAGLAPGAADRRVEGYSKGMRQKVGIAIAIAKGARVLLLDEPASGLDPLASHELSLSIRGLSESGCAILMATHDIFRARETCDRVGILIGGQRVAEVDPAQLSASELEDLYLARVRELEHAS